ncbi:protein FAM110C [Xenopus laevis]|uniref:Protein FAM110C n=2 Tax=Xenopus laevis TaxID=8355 RepID=A0A1L8G5D1_XENLA|nr:protein FAM110C [Xenopus laevis]OCT78944.1 hypothetical protein XELAEV_18030033mg [Xenopus laevis]
MPTDIMHAVRMRPIAELQHPSPAVPLRLLTRGPDYLRRQMEAMGNPRANLSAVERLAADKAKYVKTPQQCQQQRRVSGGGSSRGASESGGSSSGSSRGSDQQEGSAPVRRGSSKRCTRPDSMLIYRLKNRGEGQQQTESARVGLVRRLFIKDKPPGVSPTPLEKSSAPCPTHRLSPEKDRPDPRSRTGLHRSQSDISSRYSRSFSDFDSFFQYCGLEPEVVEELGKDGFSPAREERLDLQSRIRSVSVAASESGMSWRSEGSAGELQEEEPLSGQLPGANNNNNSCTSVIERNARIIKWLYSCKRAKETRGGSPELP